MVHPIGFWSSCIPPLGWFDTDFTTSGRVVNYILLNHGAELHLRCMLLMIFRPSGPRGLCKIYLYSGQRENGRFATVLRRIRLTALMKLLFLRFRHLFLMLFTRRQGQWLGVTLCLVCDCKYFHFLLRFIFLPLHVSAISSTREALIPMSNLANAG